MALQTLCFPFYNISVSPKWAIGHTEFAWSTLCLLFAEIGLTEFTQSAPPRWGFALALAHRSHRVLPVGPPRFLTFTFWTKSVSPSSSIRSDRVGSNVCNGWILCGGYLYPSTPRPYVREPLERAYTSSLHFLRENHLLMCWDQDIPIQPQ